MGLRERITFWCYDHPISAAVALYLVIVIPSVLLTMMLAASGTSRAVALSIVLSLSAVMPVIAYSVWRSGPLGRLSARDR